MSEKEKSDHQRQKKEAHFHRDRVMAIIILYERKIIWREGEERRERESEREEIAMVTTYNSNDSEKDDDGKCKEGNEGIGLDVGVPILIHLHQNYTTSDEHEGSVYVVDKN